MPQSRQYTTSLTITKGAPTVRVWDKPSTVPYKNLCIYVSGAFDASNVTEEVFFGGIFTDGTNQVPAFSENVTNHTGGISQGAAAAVGASVTEAANYIYQSTLIFPANHPKAKMGYVPGVTPVVVEFVNSTGDDINLTVTFVSETVNSNV